ncbi:MAG: CBS domain-containing protein [Thermomicrobiales bacterium]
MEEDIATIAASASVVEATEFFNRRKILHSAFVVGDDNRLDGVLSWWAIAKRPDGTVADHVKPAPSASPGTTRRHRADGRPIRPSGANRREGQ